MGKLLASEVIEIDDTFLEKLREKLNKDSQSKEVTDNVDTGKIYTAKQLASLTGVNRATIVRHIHAGILKGSKPAKSWIVKEEDYKEYLKRNAK